MLENTGGFAREATNLRERGAMKRILLFALVSMLMFTVTMSTVSAAPPTKLKICHVRNDGSAWVIEINEAQFPHHLAHGDQTLINPDALNVHDACVPGVD